MDSVDQRSDWTYVQSDLDLHCPQKLFGSSSVRKELMHLCDGCIIQAKSSPNYRSIKSAFRNALLNDYMEWIIRIGPLSYRKL